MRCSNDLDAAVPYVGCNMITINLSINVNDYPLKSLRRTDGEFDGEPKSSKKSTVLPPNVPPKLYSSSLSTFVLESCKNQSLLSVCTLSVHKSCENQSLLSISTNLVFEIENMSRGLETENENTSLWPRLACCVDEA